MKKEKLFALLSCIVIVCSVAFYGITANNRGVVNNMLLENVEALTKSETAQFGYTAYTYPCPGFTYRHSTVCKFEMDGKDTDCVGSDC